MQKLITEHLIKDRALILLPAFGGLILCGRFLTTGSLFFAFLIWNIILAAVPLALAFAMAVIPKKSGSYISLLILWLLFLPNSFYIITDFKHLTVSRPDWVFFDSVMLFCFAIGGIYLGVKSIVLIKQQWEGTLSNKSFKLLLPLLFLACGFGIYLGRVLRWNSWDALQHPQEVLTDIIKRLIHPMTYGET